MLEAMSSGLPVIASRVGGIPDFITDGYTGYLSDPSDDRTLEERIIEVAADDSLAKRLGRNARDKVANSADMMVVAQKTAEVFREALDRSVETD